MNKRQIGNQKLDDLKPISELNVRFSIGNAAATAAAVKELPLLLPDSGNYIMNLEGGMLQVFDVNNGVTRFRWTDLSKTSDVQRSAPETTILLQDCPGVARVVLYTAKAEDDPQAVTPSALPVLPLLQEYQQLKSKQYPPDSAAAKAADLRRMAKLARSIQEAFQPKALEAPDLAAAVDPPAQAPEKLRAQKVRERIKKVQDEPAAPKPTRE